VYSIIIYFDKIKKFLTIIKSVIRHFQIVDPWGTIIAQCADKMGIAMAEIDLALLEKIRKNMPCEQHRRNDLYSRMECQ